MVEKNKIKHMRSEAARVGFFDLPIKPVMDHSKRVVQRAYIGIKERRDKGIRSLQSLKGSFGASIEISKKRIQESKIDTIEVISTCIIVFVIGTILMLWKDLILAPISSEYMVPLGFLIAGATMGGIYTVVQRKQGKQVNSYVEYGIVASVVITTFIFSLHSSDQIFIFKSAVIAGFVGLITFITNRVALPTFKGGIKVFVYIKDIIQLISSHIGLAIIKARLNRSYSNMKNAHRKMLQEISEVESLLMIDFMLGKEASQKFIGKDNNEKEKELYYA